MIRHVSVSFEVYLLSNYWYYCACFVTNFCRTHCARMCYKETVDNLTNSAHLAIFSFPNIICTYITYKTWQQKALANLVVHDQTIEVLFTSIFIPADLLCKAANPPAFYLRKGFWAVTRQSLLPPKIYTIQYVQEFGKFAPHKKTNSWNSSWVC